MTIEALASDGPGWIAINTHRPGIIIDEDFLIQQGLTELQVPTGTWLTSLCLNSYYQTPIPDRGWLAQAILSWAEEKFTDSPEQYVPGDYAASSVAAPFRGLQPGAGSSYGARAAHGVGMAALIKHMMDEGFLTPGGIGAIYDRIHGRMSETDALLAEVSLPLTTWWPDFFRRFVASDIYGVGSEAFYEGENVTDSWIIDGPEDTEVLFSEHYPDLSARIFRMALRRADLDPSATLRFTLSSSQISTENLTTLVFGYDFTSGTGKFTYYDEGNDFPLTGLKDLYDEGVYLLLAVVVNSYGAPPYTGTGEVDLAITLEEEEPTGYAQVRLEMRLNVRRYFTDDNYEVHYFDDVFTLDRTVDNESGTPSIFRGSWEYPEDPCQPTHGLLTSSINIDGSTATLSYENQLGTTADECAVFQRCYTHPLPRTGEHTYSVVGEEIDSFFESTPIDSYYNDKGFWVGIDEILPDAGNNLSMTFVE